jgi:hypothetical protein
MTSLNMHTINNGNLFLTINPTTPNTQPHIILCSVKCRNPYNKQFPSLDTVSTDDSSTNPFSNKISPFHSIYTLSPKEISFCQGQDCDAAWQRIPQLLPRLSITKIPATHRLLYRKRDSLSFRKDLNTKPSTYITNAIYFPSNATVYVVKLPEMIN